MFKHFNQLPSRSKKFFIGSLPRTLLTFMLVVFAVGSIAVAQGKHGIKSSYQTSSQEGTNTGASQPTATPQPGATGQGKLQPAIVASGSSQTAAKPSYVPYSCTKTAIPFTTSYFQTHDGGGYVSVVGGIDGYTSKCTPDSNGNKPNDANVPPVNRTIYVGDGGASIATPIHTGETYDQVYSRVSAGCMPVLQQTNDSTAFHMCVDPIMHYNGF